jgi:hypothetical protein
VAGGCGATAVEPAFVAGITGELCFNGPPMAVGFFGPPTAFCASAGALPHRLRIRVMAAAFFMRFP